MVFAIVGDYPETMVRTDPEERQDIKVLDMGLSTKEEAQEKMKELECQGYTDLNIWEYNYL